MSLTHSHLPAIAFGTGSIYKHMDVTRYVQQALDAGFSHIDTAQCAQYVGDVIHDSGLARSDLYITTKYGFGDVQETIRKSLSNVRVIFSAYVDLYLIHNPRSVPDVDAVWKEFEIIKKDGLAKTIGVSNFTLEQLQTLIQKALVWPAVNQIEFHPYNYAKNKALLEWSSNHGILYHQIPGGPVDAPVAAAADRLGISPTQVLLSWVRAKGVVIVTTTSNKDRLEEYLAVGDLPPLSDAEVAAIDEAGAKGLPSALRVYSSVLRTKGWTAAILFFFAFLFLGQLFLRTAFTVRMGI
ncbi:Aldo/keto reductase [Mycena olivaceomarginata]|nr:Aldo/keto reductase [Mycena olivaceomarginata]